MNIEAIDVVVVVAFLCRRFWGIFLFKFDKE